MYESIYLSMRKNFLYVHFSNKSLIPLTNLALKTSKNSCKNFVNDYENPHANTHTYVRVRMHNNRDYIYIYIYIRVLYIVRQCISLCLYIYIYI